MSSSTTTEGPQNLDRTTTETEGLAFELDGQRVFAQAGESVWDVARRHGTNLPHLCHRPEPGYRPDGNCRVCMVEIEGERVLAPSCKRMPAVGMKVHTSSERARKARAMVMELLVADQPAREASHDPTSSFWTWADWTEITQSRFPAVPRWAHDPSHPAMRVNLDACIQCNLCVRACREVQVNDVIGMAYRNAGSKVVFDFDDPMGGSTCVACGECVQACPTGALMPAAYLNEAEQRVVWPDRKADSLCPYCGVGCQVCVSGEGRPHPVRGGTQRPGQQQQALRQGPVRVRLHPASASPDQAADTARRRRQGRARSGRSRQSLDAFPRGDMGGGARPRRRRPAPGPRCGRWPGARRLWFRQGIERGSLSVSEAGARWLRLQQRRSLHPALPCLVRRRPDGRAE